MESVYFDTSAFVKRFSKERASDVADMLFAACNAGKFKILISSWVVNETIAAIDRKFRRRDTSLEDRNRNISTLIDNIDLLAKNGSLEIIPVKQDIVDGSLEFVINHHLSADDALHVFSAITNSCKIFVTADRLLVEVIKETNLQGFNIEKSSEQRSLFNILNL